jgi:polyribonucleotide nucleotidyltransferase
LLFNTEKNIDSKLFSIETGKLALQANGSVVVKLGDSMILVTATMSTPREGIDFFPLTIDFEERLYSIGRIPGGFFKREGRPSTDSILINRLTDRPLRPLFPKGFLNEVQIIITSLSSDQETPLDTLSILGASAALSISDIPFNGPIAATRIGYINGSLITNPTYSDLESSELDLVAASNKDGIIMIEAGANELPDDLVVESIALAHKTNQELIEMQNDLVKKIAPTKQPFVSAAYPDELKNLISEKSQTQLEGILDSADTKLEQKEKINDEHKKNIEELEAQYSSSHIEQAFDDILNSIFRKRVLEQGKRPDGRHLKEIRMISSEVGILPRAHGSALFNRGETQILGVATLGALSEAQKLDNIGPKQSKEFMVHYNFPPYSTGETGRVGSPNRRAIGHGALAERALQPVLPNTEEFPYTIRLVAEALSSNGSTSMASTCAGCLALMDAGVPITSPVAGISIGLVTSNNSKHTLLTDIQGMEDHYGDMDFKVAGTSKGITAIQLDIKIKYINMEIVKDTFKQAKEARSQILDAMLTTIEKPNKELSPYAPRIIKISVPKEKIGNVIGPGGKTIRSIIERTNVTLDIDDDGIVTIGSNNEDNAQEAVKIIEDMTREAKVGDIFTGKVVRILDFGAFVEILPGTDGLVHISELANYRVAKVEDIVKKGDEIQVIVKGIDPVSRKISLSKKALLTED